MPILAERVRTLLPGLMREQGVDAWVLSAREYADDAAMKTLFSGEQMTARRQTILLIVDRGAGKPLETLSIARYKSRDAVRAGLGPRPARVDQFDRLAQLAARAQSAADRDQCRSGQCLRRRPEQEPARSHDRGPSGRNWRREQCRRAGLVDALAGNAHRAGNRAPGRTGGPIAPTPLDLVRLFSPAVIRARRDHRRRCALVAARAARADGPRTTWFSPSAVDLPPRAARSWTGDTVIQPGDMLWVDFGMHALRPQQRCSAPRLCLAPGGA